MKPSPKAGGRGTPLPQDVKRQLLGFLLDGQQTSTQLAKRLFRVEVLADVLADSSKVAAILNRMSEDQLVFRVIASKPAPWIITPLGRQVLAKVQADEAKEKP